MKIMAYIGARGGSKRLAKKNLQKYGDTTLMEHAIKNALRSEYIDEVVFDSEDDEMLFIASKYDVQVHKRNPLYSEDDVSLYEPVKKVLLSHPEYDIIVILQVDNPVRDHGIIDKCVACFIEHDDADDVSTFHDNRRTGTVRVIRREAFFKTMPTANIYSMEDRPDFVDIHTQEDLNKANQYLKDKQKYLLEDHPLDLVCQCGRNIGGVRKCSVCEKLVCSVCGSGCEFGWVCMMHWGKEIVLKDGKWRLKKDLEAQQTMINTHDTFQVANKIKSPVEYNTLMIYNHFRRYMKAIETLKITPDDVVVDASCGQGYGTYLVSQHAKSVYGMDINRDHLVKAIEYYGRQNILFSTYDENPVISADKIICIETIEHMPKNELLRFRDTLLSYLKKNGSLFITSPIGDDEPSTYNKFHLNEPSLETLFQTFFPFFKTMSFTIDTFINSYDKKAVYCMIFLEGYNGIQT